MSNCRAKLSAALSARVTLITVDAVVDVARHVVVLEVRWVVIPVTAGALEHGVVIGIRVARRTNVVRISVGRRELRVLRVVESRPGPGRRVVAVLTGGREKLWLRGMAGIRCVVVIGLMTADAGRRQRGVVVVYVAIGADTRWHRMRSRQREWSVVVIERGISPDHRVVAKFARGRESG